MQIKDPLHYHDEMKFDQHNRVVQILFFLLLIFHIRLAKVHTLY